MLTDRKTSWGVGKYPFLCVQERREKQVNLTHCLTWKCWLFREKGTYAACLKWVFGHWQGTLLQDIAGFLEAQSSVDATWILQQALHR